MKFEVVVAKRAQIRIRQISEWYAAQSSSAGEKWYTGVVEAMLTLESNPERCERIPELAEHQFPYDFRHLLYGSGRRKTHRIVFLNSV
ncbi:MAG: hypothetical protein DWQ34_15590 [Planctomycetota bacterium]|nr:MAG: hypothetical protein DWQ34_15590 [Planctomycetota bacterium]